ncbi:MAG: hypothetical protein C0412_13870 [Flavobacterium sp.]|nr:hypothetical protein [Flavobacterium sp.]
MKYKVLVTTSGTGSRLGEITQYTNKSLVKVGKKPAISYIIEAYPKYTDFVITLGYFGDQVRDFLEMVYPDRNFNFVVVDKYEGPGTSLGYSMLKAKKELQCPFIYHAADTLVLDQKIPAPSHNWIGGYKGEGSSAYSSFDVIEEKVREIYDKGNLNPDFLHIGLVGVNDFSAFWTELETLYKNNPNDSSLNDVKALNLMFKKHIGFKAVDFKKWYDTGNVECLQKARQEINDTFYILDKMGESIFLFDKFVVKFFSDKELVVKRVKRAKILKGLVPKIEDSRNNFYKYKYAQGDLYSKVANPNDFREFLDWANKKLWKKTNEVSKKKFDSVCRDFYYEKTVQRINKFLESRSIIDQEILINGETVPPIKEMLKKVNFEELCNADQSMFHGDFIMDNIIKTKKGYSLLDWRQDFGGLLTSGDKYYDLAKLNHNLVVNHGIVNDNLFSIDIKDGIITCDILRKENLVQCQKTLFEFISDNNLDEKKVRILTAIIWLNMSPLHHHPFDLFLYYFGKLNLWRELNK